MALGTRAFALALLLSLSACGSPSRPAPSNPEPTPEPPPASTPEDVFTAQDGTRFAVRVLATGLEIPWALAFAPDGRLFVTERPGRVRVIEQGRLLTEPALVLDGLYTRDESGLLGIALHPAFATNGFAYVTVTAATAATPVARVVRFRVVGGRFGEPAVLLDRVPANNIHNGSRVKFGPDGRLYVTFGDVASPSLAQDLSALNGKVLRLNDDGTTPADNPFGSPVWSWGHRNPQGLDWHPVTGDLYETEHGQTGNDEINAIDRGINYGWPDIEGADTRPDMRAPLTFFTPSVAPSGAAFYRGTRFPSFRSQLFVATLRGQALLRVSFDPADTRRVVAVERLIEGRYGRLRDVVEGPDGALYVCTSNRDGRTTPVASDDRVLRIAPASQP
jgi:glucose/arabinose dehydrogenase